MPYFSENELNEKALENHFTMSKLNAIAGRRDQDGKPVLLYCYLSSSSFVVQDIGSLQESYALKLFHFDPSPKLLLPVSFLKQLFFLIGNINSASILMCQFAGYHSMLPVVFAGIFHKVSLIVVGGTDCTSMPSINYGNLRKPLLRWFTLKSLKYSAHIISPGESLIECDYTYTDADYPKQGFRYFDKSIKTDVTVIFNGIDILRFKPGTNSGRRKKSFLTVCNNLDKRNFILKGIDLFMEMAIQFPECQFTIIGRAAPGFHFEKPPNVTHIDFTGHESLPSKMAEFTFYCQLSMSEGFGVALAEAMACGCVPIVSRVGIMDFIVGDTGFVLKKRDAGMLKSLIDKALDADTHSLASLARERVVEKFSSQKRKYDLQKLLHKLNRGDKR
jgi:glycosyltransferase involved in cell wall biosynthesis